AANANGGVAVAEATELQRNAYQKLRKAGMPTGPILRGAVRAVIAERDLDAAVTRFVELHHALTAKGIDADTALRYAARFLPRPEPPSTLASWAKSTAEMLQERKIRNTSLVTPEAIAIAALAPDGS